MNSDIPKIYCAGALFSDPEKKEMAEIATTLRNSSYEVFLPHENGLELAAYDVWLKRQKKQLSINIDKGIFALDTYLVTKWCDGVVVNLNGRVPDEGAVVEMAIAWACGKAIVAYKNDSRYLLKSGDNPLLSGIADFEYVQCIDHIPLAMDTALRRNTANHEDILSKGESLYKFVSYDSHQENRFEDLENLLDDLFGH